MIGTSEVHTHPRRLHELEQGFGSPFAELQDSPQKDAISVLHGMLQERCQLQRSSSPLTARGLTIEDIADLSRHAS